MMKICYVPKKFTPAHASVIEMANSIIEDYSAQGFSLTLRQLYYQFVARDLIPNTERSYKRLGGIINDGRLAGEVSWSAIEDRLRVPVTPSWWDSPADVIRAAASGYQRDRWDGQTFRVEVWIEKDALAGVIAGICDELQVPYLACRGYTSQSATWRAAVRMERNHRRGQTPVVIHLDDPSGIDMTRDITDRLALLSGLTIDVNRIALNMDQIEEHSPPPNPAKTTDSRFDSYVVEYGDDSWELDALEPRMLSDLVGDTIRSYMDTDLYDDEVAKEEAERSRLNRLAETWSDDTEDDDDD